ncbi:hypothetical protein F2Q70_00034944 [Brassica cretica]|uniref:Pectinesterase n=1 Tax=Brassica cretica TaxID=69181 RepID=A0A8S9JZD7_BRACR|nr:hypothetical protein F2Q70_00034944 [Brassica cretica]
MIFTSCLALAVDEFPSWIEKNTLHASKVLKMNANLVVAKDGSGDYVTVKEAVGAAPENSPKRFIIYIKQGVYSEIVEIGVTKTNITFVGDGQDSTILTGSLNKKDGVKTFSSATVAVNGDGFVAQDLCFQNTAGPSKSQAVALRVSAERAVIYRCRIDGYQDTLYAFSGSQLYRESYITGTVDFIFGHASAVFQYCQIVARKPDQGQSNMVTAQNRDNPSENSAFTLQRCNITASADLAPIKSTVKTYLGRPWGVMSTVVVMESFIDDHIDPAGWYTCCAGYMPCSGRCGEAKCPQLCLATEVFCCFGTSVASTRFLLQDEFQIQTTQCDNCIIGFMVCLSQVACIFSIVACIVGIDELSEASQLLSCLADMVYCTVCACMQTQHKVEMDKRDGKFGPQPMAVPPPQVMSRIDQATPPAIGYPPQGYPPSGYPQHPPQGYPQHPPQGYPPSGYQQHPPQGYPPSGYPQNPPAYPQYPPGPAYPPQAYPK